ncbi:MAG TPA: hypothetical protein VG889_20895 [Rhizomicrobium sp.]|nr:hypothetical protein [Rhizomicrobium sp.]
MAAQSTIVYADLDLGAPQPAAAVAEALAFQARESLSAGQYDVRLKPLTAEDMKSAIRAMPSGHDRLAMNNNLVVLGAGAMLACAAYRARVVVTRDPFASSEALAKLLGHGTDMLRVRLHDALIGAEKVVCLGGPAFEAVAPLVSRRPEDRMFPPMALGLAPNGKAPLLVVSNEDERSGQETIALLAKAFPSEEFRAFDPATVFANPWKAVLQLGIARSSLPGGRLSDAWAGSVPVLQLVNRTSLMAQSRRLAGVISEHVVDHGRTGLLLSSPEELFAALRDLLLDPLPMRSVARGARRKVDPAAQWDVLLKAVLQ